jgi:hypothetical protein
LPDLHRGIDIREGGARAVYEQLADDIAVALRGANARVPKKRASIGLVAKKESAA